MTAPFRPGNWVIVRERTAHGERTWTGRIMRRDRGSGLLGQPIFYLVEDLTGDQRTYWGRQLTHCQPTAEDLAAWEALQCVKTLSR